MNMLSLLPTLRHLPLPQKASAKLKIHEVLFTAERGTYETQTLKQSELQESIDQVTPPQLYVQPQD